MMQTSKLYDLYDAINYMMAHLGAEGEISNQHESVTKIMDALYELDNGEYNGQKVFGFKKFKKGEMCD